MKVARYQGAHPLARQYQAWILKEPKLRILVVDDDLAVRQSLKFELELEGMQVDSYASGGAFLDDIRPADCLVLDYRMPGMDGFALMAELNERAIRIPTILITAPVTPGIRRGAQTAGADLVLEKPLTGKVLVDNIRQLTASCA